jgi:hypothetical protein
MVGKHTQKREMGLESILSEGRELKGTLNDKDMARKHIIRYARARKRIQNEN